jgi:hypothetical protein
MRLTIAASGVLVVTDSDGGRPHDQRSRPKSRRCAQAGGSAGEENASALVNPTSTTLA